jgi:NAD(P)-dependent dehydrogenase (short-subunit alcohol dehydrogenase family)
MDLKGQNILVTGASQGIGRAIARELMAKGARVVVHYNSHRQAALDLIAEYPQTESIALQAAMDQPGEVAKLFEESVGQLGRLHTLIVNAGIFPPHKVSGDTDAWWEVWKRTLAVNLDAAGLLTKLGITHFRETGGGRFIYIGSRAAFRGETEDFLAYAASKGGLTSLARSVARSFGKDRITSFTIAPGFTRTAMAEPFIAAYGEETLLNEISLPELTLPEDISPLAAFICSGGMDHATGTVIDVNAGSYMH